MTMFPDTPNPASFGMPQAAGLESTHRSTFDLVGLKRRVTDLERKAASITNCIAYPSAAQSHTATGTFQVIALDGEEDDTGTMHDTVTNNSRIVAPSAGVYMITAQCSFFSNTVGERALTVRLNAAGSGAGGSPILFWDGTSLDAGTIVANLSRPRRLVAGDYIEMFGYQASGGNLAYNVGAYQSWLSLTKVGG